MEIFGVIAGALMILAAWVSRFFWACRYPWPFQGLREDPIGTIVIGAFRVGMFIGGVYLIVWSLAH